MCELLGMEKLKAYLIKTGVRPSALARDVGTSRGYLHDLLEGRRSPSLSLASKIAAATGGAVPLSAWAKEKGAA